MSDVLTKKELTNEVSEMLHSFMDIVSDELSTGKSVVMRNFGSFEVKVMNPKIAHNPSKLEQKVEIPKRTVPRFKPSQALKKKVALALPHVTQ